MTILVTGATGRVGRHVVGQLIASGQQVRALTRSPRMARLPSAVEVAEGDLARPDTLRAAMAGADRAYLFPLPDSAADFAQLAREAGLRKIVVLSSASVAEADEGNYSGQYHLAVETAVAGSGLEWAAVRPDEFANNILWKWGHSIQAEGVVRTPYPDAARPLIHEADVAAVAVSALLDDASAGQTYTITGPALVSQAEQVRTIGAVLGRDIRLEEVTPDQARAEMCQFMPEPVVGMVLDYLARSAVSPPPVLPAVEQITGRPARSFREWVADHAADFACQAATV